MSTDLNERLRDLFTELAEATSVETPSRFQPEQITYASHAAERSRRAKRLGLVGVTAAAFMIAAVVAIRARADDGRVSTAPIPSTDPVLWVPDTSGGVKITQYTEADEAPISQGAVRAPDGTVFGLSLHADFGEAGTTPADERQIAGQTVQIWTDASAPNVVNRTVSLGCSVLSVLTAGEDAWSSDAVALLEGVAIVDGVVRVELPSGWTSVGESRSLHQFQISFDVEADGSKQTLNMAQMPKAPAGFYLTFMQSNPQPIDLDGEQGWTAESATGYSTLVTERDGTAFFIGGPVPLSKLIDVARTLVRAPQADWGLHKDPGVSNETAAPAPAGCQVPTLEIHPKP